MPPARFTTGANCSDEPQVRRRRSRGVSVVVTVHSYPTRSPACIANAPDNLVCRVVSLARTVQLEPAHYWECSGLPGPVVSAASCPIPVEPTHRRARPCGRGQRYLRRNKHPELALRIKGPVAQLLGHDVADWRRQSGIL